jgi:hypothetical protein
MTRRPAAPAGDWALLTVDAIGVFMKRAGTTPKTLYEGAGITRPYFYSRANGHAPYTQNDIEAIAGVLGVTPLDIALMAAKIGEVPTTTGKAR